MSSHQGYLEYDDDDSYRALDCEMVGVGTEGRRSMLARVTVVNGHAMLIYDAWVQPTEPVTDYRTAISGVTAAHILPQHNRSSGGQETSTHGGTVPLVTLEECRRHVRALLSGKILIGHGLDNDLSALQLSHPRRDIRDTAWYAPFMKHCVHRQGGENNIGWGPSKLRDLAWQHLRMRIQVPGQSHSAREDAVAALRLYQSVQSEWEDDVTASLSFDEAPTDCEPDLEYTQ
jgi:RNA exonuclease 4